MKKQTRLLLGMLFFYSSFYCSYGYAVPYSPLYRGVRAQAMGDAATAVAEGEEAIFYNPAALAGHKGLSFNFASANAEVSDDVLNQSNVLTDALASPGPSAVNGLMGKNFYARGQASSSILASGFGIAGLYNYEGAVRVENEAMPQGTIGLLNTYGGQMAFGTRIARFPKKRGELRFGAAAKVMYRSGNYIDPTLGELLTLTSSTLTSQMQNTGIGYGGDVGLQMIYNIKKKVSLQAGLVMTDIGDLAFSGGAPPQNGNLKFGVAAVYRNADLVGTLAFDFARILEDIDWREKTHFGLELKFPVLTLSVGLSELELTYGAALNIAAFRIAFVSYAEELATAVFQDTERRYLINVAFKFDL